MDLKNTKNKNKILRLIYKTICKPIFFIMDPEFVHNGITECGQILGGFEITRRFIKWLFYFEDKSLEQKILGINFKNPIGLSAGFDKDGKLLNIIGEVGFGFEEVGSVTGKKCLGNTGKRLWRLKNSNSLLVYYGLKNDGASEVSKRVEKSKTDMVVGISIAKTNDKETVGEKEGIEDYIKAYREFSEKKIGDYFTINISCPNTFGGEPFTDPDKLERLLTKIETSLQKRVPVFIKLPAELPIEQVDKIIVVSERHKIDGFVCTNLAKNRENKNLKDKTPEFGGMSGKVVQELSDNLIKHIYQKTKGKFIIIGCGGIFSAEDAYRKIKNGASLLQLITGMIFEGPQLISEIKIGLTELIKKDGFKNISEAVGKNV